MWKIGCAKYGVESRVCNVGWNVEGGCVMQGVESRYAENRMFKIGCGKLDVEN